MRAGARRRSRSIAAAPCRARALRRAGFPTQRAGRVEVHEPAPARSAHVRAGRERRGGRRARPHDWIAGAGTRIVLVNGHWMPALSSHQRAAAGRHRADARAVVASASRRQSPHSSAQHAARGRTRARAPESRVLRGRRGASNSPTARRRDEPIYVVHQWSDAGRAAHEPSADRRARRRATAAAR